MSFGDIFYISGSQNPKNNQPKNGYNLRETSKGVELFYSPSGFSKRKHDIIPWQNVFSAETEHSIGGETTFDKLLGQKNVTSTLRIKYKRDDGALSELVVQSKNVEKHKAKINKKLEKLGSK